MEILLMLLILALPGGLMALLNARIARAPVLRQSPRLAEALWMLPGLGYAIYTAMLLVDVAIDPTSHNLWPIEMAMLLILWLLYAAMLSLILRIIGALMARG